MRLAVNRTWTTILALLAAVVWEAAPARAESARELTLREMVDLADDIVVGTVVESAAHWQDKLIVTVATVTVESALKGAPAGTVTVTQPGGTAVHPTLGVPVHMSASGVSVIQPGEEVVLFLHHSPAGHRVVVGGSQGSLRVRHDRTTGKRMVPVGPKGLRVAMEPGGKTVVAGELSLDDLADRVRGHVTRGDRVPGGKTP